MQRSIFTHFLRFLVFAFVAAIPFGAQASETCLSHHDIVNVRSAHLWKLNAIRSRNGADSLDANSILDDIAQDYACLLAKTGHFDHVGPDGSTLSERVTKGGYSYCMVAENLAKGYPTVDQALMGWVTSDGHWKNLKRRGVREIGLGVAYKAIVEDGGTPTQSLSQLAEDLDGRPRPKPHPTASASLVWVQVFAAGC